MTGKRRPPMPRDLYIGRCPDCGKRRYLSKRDAKTTARALDRALRPYKHDTYWHLGHQPPGVREGVVDRRVLAVPPAATRHSRAA